MNEKNENGLFSLMENFDPYSVLRDVLKNLWVVCLGAIAVGMFANVFASMRYESTYSTTTTFVVTSQSSNSPVYRNLNAAETMATNFANILNSEVLRDRVCADLEMDSFDATVSSQIIDETNLLTMRVTADTPYKAYRITRSIMRNYSDLTFYVTGNMVMQVLQQPDVPTHPDESFSAQSLMVKWFVYAFAFFIVCFVWLSLRKNTVKMQKDVTQKLAARALGTIYHEQRSRFPKFGKKAGEKVLVSDVTASFGYVEHYKKITMMLTNEAEKIQAKSIVVTSVRPREGKTTVAANLALTLAKQDYRVILMDANLRKPGMAQLLGKEVPENEGIGPMLEGKAPIADVVRYDEELELYLLLGNKRYKNSAELLSKLVTEEYLAELSKQADYIIIDTPAMSKHVDAEIIAHEADMSVLVVGYDQVLVGEINDSIDSLRDSSPKLAGCILNNVKALPGTRSAVGGYGGYGRYGHYGHYGRYGRYGHYGHYGHYGRYGYGKYGVYGHYAETDAEEKRAQTNLTQEKQVQANATQPVQSIVGDEAGSNLNPNPETNTSTSANTDIQGREEQR